MIGRCQYMTCGSMKGSSFRADFFVTETNSRHFREVLICSDCRQTCEAARDAGLQFCLTREGAVYLQMWMDTALTK